MNFKKVEIIFILAFFILDIFLINIFIDKYVGVFNQSIENQSVDIVTEFEANNIQYDEASEEVQTIPYTRTLNTNLNREDVVAVTEDTQSVEVDTDLNQIISQINTPIQLEGVSNVTSAGLLDENALTNLNNFIANEVYDGNQYQFVTYNKNEGTIIYLKQTESGYPIADGSSEIAFQVNDNYEVYGYDQTVSGDTAVQGDNRIVITESQALENAFLNNSIPNDATIVTSFLSYRKTLGLEEITLYHPVWTLFIESNEGTTQRVFVDAINGAILTQ